VKVPSSIAQLAAFVRLHPEAAILWGTGCLPVALIFQPAGGNVAGNPGPYALLLPHFVCVYFFRRWADLHHSREFFTLFFGPGRWYRLALSYLFLLHGLGWVAIVLFQGIVPWEASPMRTAFLEVLWLAQALVTIGPLPAWTSFLVLLGVLFIALIGTALAPVS